MAPHLKKDQNFWQDQSVFVTGATGLLGAELVRLLASLGANVVCLVRDGVPCSRFYGLHLDEKVAVVRGDLSDPLLLQRVLSEYEINAVFHLAAQTIVEVAEVDPFSTFETNIRGTYLLLEACRRSKKVRTIVVASSDKAYGSQGEIPYTEEAPLLGTAPYEASKACMEKLCQTYAKIYQLPIFIARCGNLYGPGDLNFNRLIPGTLRSLLRNERPLIRSSGKSIRDYLYVEDAAVAYLQLAEKSVVWKEFGAPFNFSSANKLDVLLVVDILCKLLGKEHLKPEILNHGNHEIFYQSSDSTRAFELLNWKCRYDFSEGLQLTIPWYKDYFHSKHAL